MDPLGAAITSGVVALGASLVTGFVTRKGIQDTITANSTDLEARLTHERQEAREERDQERIERAYIPVLEHLNWTVYFLVVRAGIVTRTVQEVDRIRSAVGPATSADEDRARQEVRPSPEEQRVLDAGPTVRERSATMALVNAVASEPVLKAFDAFREVDKTLTASLNEAEIAFMRGPKPGTIDLSAASAMARAKAAMDDCVSAADRVKSLVRKELRPPPT